MNKMNKMNNKKAFTLIELLVVIAIIGILSTVVLINLSSTRARARDARRRSDLANIRLALEMYYDAQATPGYPAATTGNVTPSSLATYMSGGVVPKDPRGTTYFNTGEYCYVVDGSGYQICARLETGNNTVAEQSVCLPTEASALCDGAGDLAS